MPTMNRNRWLIVCIATLTVLILFPPEMSAAWPFKKGNAVTAEEHKDQGLFTKGYFKGFAAGVNSVVGPISDLQKKITHKMSREFIPLSVAVIFFTLWGPLVFEKIRTKVKAMPVLKIVSRHEIPLFFAAYAFIIVLIVAYTLSKHYSLSSNIPVFLLLGASFYPFCGEFIAGITKNDPGKRKIGLAKVKTLIFFALVFLVMYYMTSDGMTSLLKGELA